MIGQIVSHFKITGKLGEGGMGVVYKTRDTHLDRKVALKFFTSSSTTSDKERQHFIREARVAAALSHPNICTIHNVDFLVIAMCDFVFIQTGRKFLAIIDLTIKSGNEVNA